MFSICYIRAVQQMLHQFGFVVCAANATILQFVECVADATILLFC